MSNEIISFDDRYSEAREWLLGPVMQEKMKLALPRHVDPGRLVQLYLTEFRKTPKLLECSGESLLGGLMQIAQLGLDVGTRGHAWLIPYKVKGTMTANVVIGYKGMLDLAWRSEKIAMVYAHDVRFNDEFEYAFGSSQFIKHRPEVGERGEIMFAYAGCETTLGGKIMDVMQTDEIEAIRDRDRAKTSGPWVTDYPQMCCKTVLRRMLKLAPCSVELATAISLDEKGELGIPQGLEVDITPAEEPAQKPEDAAEDADYYKCEACKGPVDPSGDQEVYRYDNGGFGDLFRCAECGKREA